MSNLNLPIPDDLIDVTFDKFDGMLDVGYSEEELCAAGASPFPDKFRIPRSEWDDRIREHEKFQSSADFYGSHFTHQGKSHECTAHAATQVFEVAWNRQFAGTSHAVWFSPLALYTRLTGGRQWGGSMVSAALRLMMSEGLLPEHDGPGGQNDQQKRFKHTVHQTSGRSESHWPTKGWIRPSDLPEGWQETAKHFVALEAFTIPSGDREAHASCLLQGWALGNGREGHAIPHKVLCKRDRDYLSKYRDSYNVWRFDSERLWGGGYCIRAVTHPADASRPAGEQMK